MTGTLQKLGLTPAKGAMIVALALVMAWVWSPLLLGESKPPRPKAIANADRDYEPRSRPAHRKPSTPAEKAPVPTGPLVKMTLGEATRHDPFATPDWAPLPPATGVAGRPSSPSALRQRFDSLASSGVAMLLISEQGRAAQIGERTVQVGDVIDGFRVVEISPQGVKFVPDDQGDGHGA